MLFYSSYFTVLTLFYYDISVTVGIVLVKHHAI